MKLKLIIIIGIICTIVIATLSYALNKSIEKNKVLTANQSVLLSEAESYKVNDSLNVLKIGELRLTLKEYEKFRAEDKQLIDELKADKINSVEKVKIETKIEKEYVPLFDTIILHTTDTIFAVSTHKAFNYTSKWNDVTGIILEDSVVLDITNREELVIVENLQKKKLWFIKLPPAIFGYKSKSIDIVSKNPKTTIVSAEKITVK